MKQYLDVVRHVLEQGSWQKNRTQWRTLSVPGVSLRLDMLDGFPALTTRSWRSSRPSANLSATCEAKTARRVSGPGLPFLGPERQ